MTDELSVEGDDLSAGLASCRLTIMFCDVVGSTELSGRQDPESYRELMRGYREACREVIEDQFEGHIVQLKGDGALSTFGFPVAHENDAERAVGPGWRSCARCTSCPGLPTRLPASRSKFASGSIMAPSTWTSMRKDVYGLTANIGARLHALAEPGTVVVSDEVRQLVEGLRDRARRAANGEGRRRAAGSVPRRRRAACLGASLMVHAAGGARGGARAAPRAWAQVAAGVDRPIAALVRGDAGVGKTRLVAAIADESARPEAASSCCTALPSTGAGFHPVRTLIESRSGIADHAESVSASRASATSWSTWGSTRRRAIPLLSPLLGIDPERRLRPGATEGRKLEEQVARALLGYIVACTRGQPSVVVAENLHWFDGATHELLDDLIRSGPRTALVIGTSRDQERGPWGRHRAAAAHAPGPARGHRCARGGPERPHRLALAQRSSGIPLYLEELVRADTVQPPADQRRGSVGSVPEVLYEPLVGPAVRHPGGATGRRHRGRHRPGGRPNPPGSDDVDPAEELDDTLRLLGRASWSRSRAAPTVIGFGTSCCGRWPELQPPSWRRRSTTGCATCSRATRPSDWHVLASHFERAEREGGRGVPAHGGVGAPARRAGGGSFAPD